MLRIKPKCITDEISSQLLSVCCAYLSNHRHNLSQRWAERCTHVALKKIPSETTKSKFHGCQRGLRMLPLTASVYRKLGENMRYFWMFSGIILLILFLASLICLEYINCYKALWFTRSDIFHFFEHKRRVCFFYWLCRWSEAPFVHCYTESILCTPTIFHPNKYPQ